LWSGLHYLAGPARGAAAGPLSRRLHALLVPLLVLVCLTIPAGALVAGLHAGLVYNTFPLMGDSLLPADAFDLHPLWRNAFENLTLVQFDHRLLATVTWAAAVAAWLTGRRLAPTPRARLALSLVPLAATLQASLGIATLLLVVPVHLAATHQAGAFLRFTAVLWALFESRRG